MSVSYEEFLEAFFRVLPPAATDAPGAPESAGPPPTNADRCPSHTTLTPPAEVEEPVTPETLDSARGCAADWRRCAALLVLNPATAEASARACFDRLCGGPAGQRRLLARDFGRCLASLCENVGLPADSPAGALVGDVASELLRDSQESATREVFCISFHEVLHRAAVSPEMEDGISETHECDDLPPAPRGAPGTPEARAAWSLRSEVGALGVITPPSTSRRLARDDASPSPPLVTRRSAREEDQVTRGSAREEDQSSAVTASPSRNLTPPLSFGGLRLDEVPETRIEGPLSTRPFTLQDVLADAAG